MRQCFASGGQSIGIVNPAKGKKLTNMRAAGSDENVILTPPTVIYIYYSGQESLRRNGVAIMVNKRVQNAVLGGCLKNNRMISVRFHPGGAWNATPRSLPSLERKIRSRTHA